MRGNTPDEKTVRVFDEFLLFVLSDETLLLDLLDHRLGGDINLVLLERRHRVVTVERCRVSSCESGVGDCEVRRT